MIGYQTLGVRALDEAQGFYGPLVEALGGKCVHADERMVFYAAGEGAMLAICTPYDGGPASAGNGTMTAFRAASRADVDRVHAKALELGAGDEGAPGLREPVELQFYGAYFRCPDGHKFCVYIMGGGH